MPDQVRIALLPATDGPSALAWLPIGGWIDCPAVEHHIAALRSLRDRYGAELIACAYDGLDLGINLRLARRPTDPQEGLALARELAVYCPDSVDHGEGTLFEFAAVLMASEWWTFWWD